MATPDFIRVLRATAGNQLLWLPGVTAVVFDDEGRVLLNRRSDNRRWSLIGGIAEPGSSPPSAPSGRWRRRPPCGASPSGSSSSRRWTR